jgi:hypothetical protein
MKIDEMMREKKMQQMLTESNEVTNDNQDTLSISDDECVDMEPEEKEKHKRIKVLARSLGITFD